MGHTGRAVQFVAKFDGFAYTVAKITVVRSSQDAIDRKSTGRAGMSNIHGCHSFPYVWTRADNSSYPDLWIYFIPTTRMAAEPGFMAPRLSPGFASAKSAAMR